MGSQAGRNAREEKRSDRVSKVVREQADPYKVSRDESKKVLKRVHEADMDRIGTGFKK
jgi:hypothetical protein